jgi:putative Holliday junction resolvase
MRTLSIDLGTRRVGLALSDEGGRFATPYEVLTVSTPQQAASEILRVIRREGVQRLVLGLPLNMDGSIGPAAQSTIAFARALTAQLQIPLIFIDERLTSFDAEQQLNDRKRAGEKLTRKRRKEQLDAIAAATILQDFLDGRLSPISVD